MITCRCMKAMMETRMKDSREFASKCAGHAMDKLLLNEGPGATLEPPQEISPYWRVLV